MIIKNISDRQSWVPDLRNKLVMVQPWEEVEVHDVKGKYLTTSYGHIFKQVNTIETPVKEPKKVKVVEEVIIPTEPELDLEPVVEPTIEDTIPVEELDTEIVIEPTEEIITNEVTTEPELDLDLWEDISILQAEYLAKFEKEVPPRFKNDVEWIKAKLNS